MRSAAEIQRAHDILVAMLVGEVPRPQGKEEVLVSTASVLCWVLKHDHNPTFETLIANLEKGLQELGYTLEDTGELRKN